MTTPRLSGPTPGSTSSEFSLLARCLAEDGYVIVPHFLPHEISEPLVEEIATLWHDGTYRHAAVGRGNDKQVRAEIRSDHVRWIDPGAITAAQRGYWRRMEALRLALNHELFLGLFDFEAHLACFPSGAHYKAHLDRHRQSEDRIISTVIYLNPEWNSDDGGILRLYTDRVAGVEGPFTDVIPEFGKLVLFFSGDFWHEVLPAHRERHSITGWFRRRPT